MAALSFGEDRLPRRYRGWSLLRHSSPGCSGWIGYDDREPLPQESHSITDTDGASR